MSSRERVLAALRAQTLPRVALPELAGPWIEYPDLLEQFRAALARAAGSALLAPPGALRAAVAALPEVRRAQRCCSLAPEVPGNVPAPSSPHACADVDVLIVEAAFGVAENGAVWLDERTVPVRAGLFLTQHLVVLLERRRLVPHLHAAYERLGTDAGRAGYGCFISGPSKTADIEQALVVGAHGPRSLTVVLYGS
jgi:L-lactate dehydrogenase complex protein LldG